MTHADSRQGHPGECHESDDRADDGERDRRQRPSARLHGARVGLIVSRRISSGGSLCRLRQAVGQTLERPASCTRTGGTWIQGNRIQRSVDRQASSGA